MWLVATRADGVRISEHMPRVAEQMRHLNIIRSLTTTEGDHMRGTLIYYNHPKRDATIEHRQWAPSYDQGWPHHPERFGSFEFITFMFEFFDPG